MYRFVLALVVLQCFGCGLDVSDDRKCEQSLLIILVEPESCLDKEVTVYGHIRNMGDYWWLFLTREGALAGDFSQSVMVSYGLEAKSLEELMRCHDSYVELRGRFLIFEELGVVGISDVRWVTKFDRSDDFKTTSRCYFNGELE